MHGATSQRCCLCRILQCQNYVEALSCQSLPLGLPVVAVTHSHAAVTVTRWHSACFRVLSALQHTAESATRRADSASRRVGPGGEVPGGTVEPPGTGRPGGGQLESPRSPRWPAGPRRRENGSWRSRRSRLAPWRRGGVARAWAGGDWGRAAGRGNNCHRSRHSRRSSAPGLT